MNGAAFVGICVLLFVRYSLNKPRKITVSILAMLFVLAVGFSRVYLGVHNPTDILAGYAMGIFLSLLALCIGESVENLSLNFANK
jgi:undecaprenyl-diphosphatase